MTLVASGDSGNRNPKLTKSSDTSVDQKSSKLSSSDARKVEEVKAITEELQAYLSGAAKLGNDVKIGKFLKYVQVPGRDTRGGVWDMFLLRKDHPDLPPIPAIPDGTQNRTEYMYFTCISFVLQRPIRLPDLFAACAHHE